MKAQDYERINAMTFDVAGTLIDFEQGIVNYFEDIGCKSTREDVLKTFGHAEGLQQIESPEMPFTQMLIPIYDRMAVQLQLPNDLGEVFRNSIQHWPAFPDSVDALRRLK